MKYALVNNMREEATKNQVGDCPLCKSPVRAYCGEFMAHHWKHINLDCDTWNEPETEWHRNWKNKFIEDWQEIVKFDALSNEKHIADIYNPHIDLVIEFQNSPISNEEIKSREEFYKKLIWVLNLKDITKNLKFYHNFDEGVSEIAQKYCKKWDAIPANNLGMKGESPKEQDLDRVINEIESWENISDKKNLLFLDWKYKPKRWEYNSAPVFLDLDDDRIYLIRKRILNCSALVVQPFDKATFISHYSRMSN